MGCDCHGPLCGSSLEDARRLICSPRKAMLRFDGGVIGADIPVRPRRAFSPARSPIAPRCPARSCTGSRSERLLQDGTSLVGSATPYAGCATTRDRSQALSGVRIGIVREPMLVLIGE